jgi:hypothetical protein
VTVHPVGTPSYWTFNFSVGNVTLLPGSTGNVVSGEARHDRVRHFERHHRRLSRPRSHRERGWLLRVERRSVHRADRGRSRDGQSAVLRHQHG